MIYLKRAARISAVLQTSSDNPPKLLGGTSAPPAALHGTQPAFVGRYDWAMERCGKTSLSVWRFGIPVRCFLSRRLVSCRNSAIFVNTMPRKPDLCRNSTESGSYLCKTMRNFAAIDLKAANSHRESVCSVGVVVRNGGVSGSFYELVRPGRRRGVCRDCDANT
jgi:hypothetical protein